MELRKESFQKVIDASPAGHAADQLIAEQRRCCETLGVFFGFILPENQHFLEVPTIPGVAWKFKHFLAMRKIQLRASANLRQSGPKKHTNCFTKSNASTTTRGTTRASERC